MRLTIMNYDENIFKEKANRKARKIWLIFALLLSANYGSDVANGLQKADYYITVSYTHLTLPTIA